MLLYFKVPHFSHQEYPIPGRIQLQSSVLHPDPETAKASYSVQNVGSVFHGQQERGHRMDNKTGHDFFFPVMIIVLQNSYKEFEYLGVVSCSKDMF